MRADARRRGAAVLAGLACVGLAIGPLLHAESHLAEQRQLRQRALARAFELAFARVQGESARAELAHALELALGSRTASGAAPGTALGEGRAGAEALPHPHPDGTGHSHGPGPGHAAGSLAHLSLALHSAPPQPAFLAQVPPPAARPSAPRFQHAVPRYLVPERSQAPPSA